MQTVQVKLFRLHELAPKAKAKALESLCDELQTAVQRVLRDASNRCEQAGYADIEYQTGEESAAEYADVNGLWFTENGQKWTGAEPEGE